MHRLLGGSVYGEKAWSPRGFSQDSKWDAKIFHKRGDYSVLGAPICSSLQKEVARFDDSDRNRT